MAAPVFAAAIDPHDMPGVIGLRDREAAFKVPVPVTAETKHSAAENAVGPNWSAGHVLDNEGSAAAEKPGPDRLNQVWITGQILAGVQGAKPLARRTRPNEIELSQIKRRRQRVSLHK